MAKSKKTLEQTLQDLKRLGFTDNFKPHTETIAAMKANHVYYPAQLKVIEKFQFEPESDTKEPKGMLAIEGVNGIKGTLVYSIGPNNTPSNHLISMIPVEKPSKPKPEKKVTQKAKSSSEK